MLPQPAKPEFKQLGGSDSDHFNQLLADQTLQALWIANSDEEQRDRQYLAATAAMIGAKPQNELEGMLIAQMVACHSATMECYRRGLLAEQSFEGRQFNLSAANKLSRTYAMLLDALNRHRGKGQQVVRVEHVTVQAGGQAIVGAVTQGGRGPQAKRGSTPCTCPYTRARDAVRGPAAGAPAGRRRCRVSNAAGCMAAPRAAARPPAIATP